MFNSSKFKVVQYTVHPLTKLSHKKVFAWRFFSVQRLHGFRQVVTHVQPQQTSWIVIACKAVNWVSSLKRAGSGPIQSPVGNPIKKGLRMTQVDQVGNCLTINFSTQLWRTTFWSPRPMFLQLRKWDSAPKLAQLWQTAVLLQVQKAPQCPTATLSIIANFFFLAFGRCRSKARS